MNQTNQQKVALVTGASRRIGAAIARHLHQAGYRIVVHCLQSYHDGQALVQEMNQKKSDSAKLLVADLGEKSAILTLVDEAVHWAGRLDLLVNNASIFTRNDADWDKLFNINTKAPFYLSHAAFSHLAVYHGAIINITDIHAEQPLKGYAVYCQSKAALLMQTKALAVEFAPNVRVNAVAPGAIMWPETENALDPVQQQTIIAKTLLKQHGNSLFIAQAVLALADNPFITGQSLRVDGGRG
ncbi:pteridine reductase [bacterium]|nr:pteridine reductase [bacterium]